MTSFNRIRNLSLTVLLHGSALSAIIRPCPMAAIVCGIMALALGFEQYLEAKSEVRSAVNRITSLEVGLDQLNKKLIDLDAEDIKARSEEIKSMLSTMKLNNLYARK